MLKQILSVSDVKKLEVGDHLSDHPEPGLGKIYVIQNISTELIYAIHENGHFELKVLASGKIPEKGWWMISPLLNEYYKDTYDASNGKRDREPRKASIWVKGFSSTVFPLAAD